MVVCRSFQAALPSSAFRVSFVILEEMGVPCRIVGGRSAGWVGGGEVVVVVGWGVWWGRERR